MAIKLTGDAAALLDKADGIIDFTAPAATLAFAALAAEGRKVHIIGTTGLSTPPTKPRSRRPPRAR